jgi:hypothetical protein
LIPPHRTRVSRLSQCALIAATAAISLATPSSVLSAGSAPTWRELAAGVSFPVYRPTVTLGYRQTLSGPLPCGPGDEGLSAAYTHGSGAKASQVFVMEAYPQPCGDPGESVKVGTVDINGVRVQLNVFCSQAGAKCRETAANGFANGFLLLLREPGPTSTLVEVVSTKVSESDLLSVVRSLTEVRSGAVQPPAGAPAPTFATTVDVAVVSGTVLTRPPGTTTFSRLGVASAIPVGSVIDTRRGRVRLYSANAGGVLQAADFYQGQFKVLERASLGGLTDLILFGGSFSRCGSGKAARAATGGAIGAEVRHLWGAGLGKFRTTGRFSSATIRGTTWLTDDRCNGTLTRVTAGSVAVRDRVHHRTIVLKAPGLHFARGRR